MLDRLRVPIRRAPPTAVRRDTTMRFVRTHVLGSCLNQARMKHQLVQLDSQLASPQEQATGSGYLRLLDHLIEVTGKGIHPPV